MLVPALHVGVPSDIGPLSVFPVWADLGAAVPLSPPGDAHLEIRESATPSVDHLLVTNTGPLDALLLEGELLEGGKQHRVVAVDVIVPAHESMTVAVACVEQGRWSDGRDHRRGVRRASVRVRQALQLPHPGLRQHQVWQRVTGYESSLGASATESLVEHLDTLSGQRGQGSTTVGGIGSAVDEAATALAGLRPLPGQNGYLVGVDAQPVLLELFADQATLAAHLTPGLTGVLMDAVAAGRPWSQTPGRRARRLAARISGLDLAAVAEVDSGAGRAFGWADEGTTTRGMAHGGAWVHLTALQLQHALLA